MLVQYLSSHMFYTTASPEALMNPAHVRLLDAR
jgi:hypothetical protein